MSSKYIVPYMLAKEYQCSHCHKLPPMWYHDDGGRYNKTPKPHEEIMETWVTFRTQWGKPVDVAGYRCMKHQLKLFLDKKSSALLSAHILGMGLDLDFDSIQDVLIAVEMLKHINPDLRIGKYVHTGTFVHIDTAYLAVPRLDARWHEGASWSK